MYGLLNGIIFTMQCYTSAVYAVIVCLCPSIRQSVTSRLCTKTG